MPKLQKFVLPLLLIFIATFMGCSGGTGVSISGKVTLDGEPLDDATISFVPISSGQQDAGWATVEDGRFTVPTSSELGTGQFRIEIRALRSAGQANSNDPTLVEAKEIIPIRYNLKSELTREIKIGQNQVDFDLTSKPAASMR
jgi:hypothetical protein